MKRLIVITGPTACGKTSVSVNLAKSLQTEIISCDSRQFYQEMAIGTAKPTLEEMDGIRHHFIDSHPITDEITAGRFEREALILLDKLFLTHNDVILTGGSGLFIDALVNGFDDMPKVAKETREALNHLFQTEGLAPLMAQLKDLDPDYAKQVDVNNPKRIIRALEICLTTKKPYSALRTGQKAKRNFEVLKIVLDRQREELYQRINQRVDIMDALGLEKEVRALLPFKHLNAMQTVGYREFFDFFEGNITRERAIELIKRNSRRYAKRQLTWFRRDTSYHWVHPENKEEILRLING